MTAEQFPTPQVLQTVENRLQKFANFYHRHGQAPEGQNNETFAFQGSRATRSEYFIEEHEKAAFAQVVDETADWVQRVGIPFQESEMYESFVDDGYIDAFDAQFRTIPERPQLEMMTDTIPISSDPTSAKLYVEYHEEMKHRYIVFHINHSDEFSLSMNFFNPHTGDVKYTYSTGNTPLPIGNMTREEYEIMTHYITTCRRKDLSSSQT